jgi:serine/threonine-protein kinase
MVTSNAAMGIRDFFRKLFRTDPYPVPDGADDEVDASPDPPPASAPATRIEPDPLSALAGLSLPEAVRQARVALDAPSITRMASLSLLRWLRQHARHPDLAPTLRIELADFFLMRGERDVADGALRELARAEPAHAPPAMMRLGDLAAEAGDTTGALGWYESVLAIDLEYPGARERHARLRRPVRAGEAGATLLAPDASQAMGRFELVRELGRGSAGAVYLARDKRVGREVALKIYHPQARSDRNARLRGEAQVAAAVAAPTVVRVYDLLEETGALAMEYAAGGSLRLRIARATVTPVEARGWVTDVAAALARTHERGWVHRDLKPGNVLLRNDGRAVLTDFGLARKIAQSVPPAEGTVGYIPPEARGGGVAHPNADTFAFGALLRDLALDRDARYEALARACLADDPAQRPSDGAALLTHLKSLS